MKKITPAQQAALASIAPGAVVCAYDLGVSLKTLEVLWEKGYLENVTGSGPGGLYSPRTHFKFRLASATESE